MPPERRLTQRRLRLLSAECQRRLVQSAERDRLPIEQVRWPGAAFESAFMRHWCRCLTSPPATCILGIALRWSKICLVSARSRRHRHGRRRRFGAHEAMRADTTQRRTPSAARMVCSASSPRESPRLFEVGQFRTAHGPVELGAELRRLPLDDADILLIAQEGGQIFGPMTRSATMPRIKSLLEVMSNIGSTLTAWSARPTSERCAGAADALLDQIERSPLQPTLLACTPAGSAGLAGPPSIDLGGASFFRAASSLLRLVVLRHALLKLFDAFAIVTKIRDIRRSPPEHQQATGQKQQPMPTLSYPFACSSRSHPHTLGVCHYRRKGRLARSCHTACICAYAIDIRIFRARLNRRHLAAAA